MTARRPSRRPAFALLSWLLVLLPCPFAAAAGPADALIARISWLGGCWESVDPARGIEEQWMRPRGGVMLGMSRTVRDGRTREFEQMRIEEQEGRLVFTSRPSGQAEASFGSVEVTATSVVFENPDHDFPQRIIYRMGKSGILQARIEGTQAGKVRGGDFPMRRTACSGEGK